MMYQSMAGRPVTIDDDVVEDEDDELELPRQVGDSVEAHDPTFEPDDDEDLGLITTGDAEDVGLDVDTGPAGAGDDDDYELAAGDEEESGSWREAGEEAGDLDGELGDGSDEIDEAGGEDGWTEGNDPDEEQDFDDTVLTFDERTSFVDDGGAEGLSDDALELEVDPSQLPKLESSIHDGVDPLDQGSPEDLEDLALDLLEGIGGGLEDEATAEVAEGLNCTRLAADRVRVDRLHEAGQPLIALTASARHGLAFFDGTLLVCPNDAAAPERRYTRARALWDMAAADTRGGLFVALATPEGLLCSQDGGRSFSPAGSLPGGELPPNRVAITRDGDALRLWAAAPEGALCASDDGGRSFAPVLGDARILRLASDGRRALLGVARDEDGTAVAEHTIDGGGLFERLELPAGEVERLQDVRVGRETVLACRRAPEPRLLIGSAEDPWLELLAHAAPPATLIDEDGGTVAYCCVETGDDDILLLRRSLDGGLTPQVVARLPRDAGAPMQLDGFHSEGVTTLHVGAERAWLRVTLRTAGGGR